MDSKKISINSFISDCFIDRTNDILNMIYKAKDALLPKLNGSGE